MSEGKRKEGAVCKKAIYPDRKEKKKDGRVPARFP